MTPQELLKFHRILDHELHEIYLRLGEVILVPIAEDNTPLAQPKSFAETQQATYLRRLSESNIAVVLGPASGDLYAVEFQTPEASAVFTDANPVARRTAVLCCGGVISFFRVNGFSPPSIQWESGGEWLGMAELVPLRVRGQSGLGYEWLTNFTPAKIEFADLVWRKEVQALFTPKIVEAKYGRPFYPGRKRPEMNYAFWAHYFALECHIRYAEERGEFYRRDRTGAGWESLSGSVLEASILEFLLTQGRLFGCEALQRPIDAAARKKLIRELKVVALGRLAGLEAGLKLFVAECLEKWPGGTISVRELYVVYSQFCRSRNFPILSEARFQRMSPELIQLHYQSERSNSIPRPNGEVRGYRGIRPKLTVIEGGPEADGKAEEGSTAKATTENREQNG